jgi:hypothetical protein
VSVVLERPLAHACLFSTIHLYFLIIQYLYFDHAGNSFGRFDQLSPKVFVDWPSPKVPSGRRKQIVRKADETMNGLHLGAQIVLSGVFLFDGLTRVLAHRHPAKIVPAWPAFGSIRLSHELAVAIALAEIGGALALWIPADLWRPGILPQLAAAGLALLAVAGVVYHMRRKEPAAPNLALFLLALFVILGRW